MRLQIVSDLHLESWWLPPFKVHGDVVVIAGDTHGDAASLQAFIGRM
ncbi:MAG: hypothetical protein M3T49_03280 [Candidatus Eremiobacteraeota bacterium]|nr:hypothetical protein [Candidatus Eremiobacteraeota bacterium]